MNKNLMTQNWSKTFLIKEKIITYLTVPKQTRWLWCIIHVKIKALSHRSDVSGFVCGLCEMRERN